MAQGAHGPLRRLPIAARAVAAAVQGGLALAAYVGGTTLHTGPQVARWSDDADDEPTVGDGCRRGVRLEHDGRYEWVFIDARRVARLVPPADVEVVLEVEEVLACGGRSPCRPPPEASAFSLDFLLAENVGPDMCLTFAQVLYTAVRHHRVRPAARPSYGESLDAASGTAFTPDARLSSGHWR
jgi:hypothetical protein